ncbi:hypothetical protein Xmau_03772 [Xenorhabdus mauleonii]|uniref:Uncharacterized protein n=1 Tax=Xenorhabdus mauleonii TaxID=351675 RepID=A0A1I3Y1J5_9GAMM|nr:hypothetical protein [Xenorhabdus mauleonii]PHM37808.1 hypothetical protein Xmau_03772 [Xenorhabdus mauleonii]SFK25126.1 hypothetical protein SAMN05421680_14112 [Xenorhabdus mauleonii]
MNQRISFFKLDTKLTTKNIVSSLLNMRYTEEKNSGFMLSKVNGSRIKAKHIYKYEKTSDLVTPFGEIKKNSLEEYYINEFILHEEYIEILNAAKNLSHFRRDLIRALDNQCIISNFELDLKKFMGLLPNEIDSIFYVSGLEIYSKSIIENSTLKLGLSSNKDIFDKINKFLPNSNYELRRLNLNIDNDRVEIELNSRGNVKIIGDKLTGEEFNKISRCLLTCKIE